MENKNGIKHQLLNACQKHIASRIESFQKVLQSIEDSRNNETKSSVGDKYETGRAMMQLEEEKNKSQLFEAYQVKQELTRIDPRKTSIKVEMGSLVETNKGNYYISIGIGKILINETLYYAISIMSPIGMKLRDKKVGDELEFNGNKIEIKRIY